MNKYKMTMKSDYWECGDGCCSGEETTVFINHIEIGTYSELHLEHHDGLRRFLARLNESEQDLVVSFTVDVDEYGELEDALYLNDVKITNTCWECRLYTDILDSLEIPYSCRLYEVEWDIWKKEKRLVLVLEEEDEEEAS